MQLTSTICTVLRCCKFLTNVMALCFKGLGS
jgi:hypothetical protein